MRRKTALRRTEEEEKEVEKEEGKTALRRTEEKMEKED